MMTKEQMIFMSRGLWAKWFDHVSFIRHYMSDTNLSDKERNDKIFAANTYNLILEARIELLKNYKIRMRNNKLKFISTTHDTLLYPKTAIQILNEGL